MKAMLIILILTAYGENRINHIEIPMSTYEHCLSIADITGKLIADDLREYAHSVSTECVNQGE